jgi:head-tail adaptor
MPAFPVLREVVVVEMISPTAVPDGGGHVDPTDDANWTVYCTRRANVVGTGSREQVSPDMSQMTTLNSYRVTLRYDPTSVAIGTKMRFRWAPGEGSPTRTLNISGCHDPDGTRRQLIFDCVERR